MEKIYIISAEYGDYDDHCKVEIYVATDAASAETHMGHAVVDFKAAYARMVDAMAHGFDAREADMVGVNEHIAEIANSTYWSEGVSLVLTSMPVGKMFRRAEYIESVHLSLYPEGWDQDRLSREGDQFIATKYELMAEPHEQKYGVA